MQNRNNTMPKPYALMTSDEKTAHIESINDYVTTTLPALRAKGRALGRKDIDEFHRGLRLIGAFPQYAVFSVRLMAIRVDYDQYIASLEHQFRLLIEQLKQEHTYRMPSGQPVIVLPQAQSLRRGRPTQAESERRKREEQAAAHAEAMSRLTGAQISTTEAAPIQERDSDTSRRKKDDEPDLFDAAIAAAVSEAANGDKDADDAKDAKDLNSSNPSNSSNSSNPSPAAAPLLALRDWYFLLSDSLVARLKTERDLRSEMTHESETAKIKFEQGATVDEIAPHTMRVKELGNEINDIHHRVDRELAQLYIMLTQVNADWGGYVEKYAKQQQGTREQLIARLKPYCDKLTQAIPDYVTATLARCKAMEEERIRRETRDPEKEKRLHTIDAYIRRKDVNATEKRLAKMREYRVEAEQLGAEPDSLTAYDVFIETCAKILSEAKE